ncbi:twin-arginine translocation signal domain-containing protein [Actinomadura sp. KC06]|uniref:twin-arginine translocation signal domain-containing protein n=1 Tax=Actinomadura sp. KC06 TaxID=2530369 RepID=UPI00104454BE|nr:twin-arginine translocation signal domain-containing protein [Actinomadura sp. KC06]TDD34668.1 twin-arginine translocation signal domain-containing protein [Actinomadura sp. KC06]
MDVSRGRRATRRGFMATAGMTVAGGTVAFGLPDTATADPRPPAALSGERQRAYRALVEVVANLSHPAQAAGIADAATRRLAARYDRASAAERQEMDGVLDAVEAGLHPGAFAAQPLRIRISTLADRLAGPMEGRLTPAIALAVAGVHGFHDRDRGPAAGRLHARAIRALPAQRGPGRTPGAARTTGASCAAVAR